VKNNSEVRRLLGDRGVIPEELSAAEDAKKVERRLDSEAKKIGKVPKLRRIKSE
jgi:DNA-damage-inducible protein D